MRKLVAVMMLSTALAAQEPAGSQAWKVTHAGGPAGQPGQKLLLTISAEQLSFTTKKKLPVLSIPMQQVTEMVYSPVRFPRTQQGDKYGTDGSTDLSDCGAMGLGCAGLAAVGLVVFAAEATMHGTSHYVTVTWADRGVEQQMEFEVGKNDVAAVSDRLKSIAGDKWINIEEQSRRVEELIREHQVEAIELKLDRDSLCGGNLLSKGDYRVLAVASGGEADVFFFAEAVSFSQLRGIARAQAENHAQSEVLEYAPDSARIVALRWGEKSLRFVKTK